MKEDNNTETNSRLEIIAGERPPSAVLQTVPREVKVQLLRSQVDTKNNLDLAQYVIESTRHDSTDLPRFFCLDGELFLYDDGVGPDRTDTLHFIP